MTSKSHHRRNFLRPSFSAANAKEPTHFFKIIRQDVPEENTKIPNEFVRRFEDEMSTSEATIRVPDGRFWKMEMKKSENEVRLCKGWEEFSKYYSLSYGFFVVFNYEGNSQFSAIIFDLSATEIHYPLNLKPQKQNSMVTKCSRKRPKSFDHCGDMTRSMKQKLKDEDEIIDIEDEDALEDYKSGNGDRNGKEEISDSTEREKEKNRRGRGHYSIIRKRAMEMSQNIKPPKLPSFTAIIKPSNLNRYHMYVPFLFWKEYMEKMLPLKLEDSEGRKWKVDYYKYGTTIKIGRGWTDFARANNVKEGNKCVFELIRGSRNFVFKVTIFSY